MMRVIAPLLIVLNTASIALGQVVERVSVRTGGGQTAGLPGLPSVISADGCCVAFISGAADLVPNDANGFDDVFVHDRRTRTTERVNISSTGAEANFVSSGLLAINATGRFVVFSSDASNLVPNDVNFQEDIFVHDRETGVTELVSISTSGIQGDGGSEQPAISADGRFIAFISRASNFVENDRNADDVFVRDRLLGTTERVSVSSAGVEQDSFSFLREPPSISADGRFVCFSSPATNLVEGDTNGFLDVFVHDRQTRTTERVSLSSTGRQAEANDTPFSFSSISTDGRFVAFGSFGSDLVPNDTNGTGDIFLRDRALGTTVLISATPDGRVSNGFSDGPAVTADGRLVLFISNASDLVQGITNANSNFFLRDVQTGLTQRFPMGLGGEEANGGSGGNSITPDGRFVAFISDASNLVAEDTNGLSDVFVLDRLATPAPMPGPLMVEIDVKPGPALATIRPMSSGVVHVAILGSMSLDVHDIDRNLTRLGPSGASPTGKSMFRDVNRDGLEDLVLPFRTGDTGVRPGDTELCLSGARLDGKRFVGCDAIRTGS